MRDERISAPEERYEALARALEEQRAHTSFVDDRLVAAELVICALVRRLRSEQGAIEEVRGWVSAWTAREGEEGRRIANHADHLLSDI